MWEPRIASISPSRTKSGRYPCYHVYETKEGEFISLVALEPRFWEVLCRKLGYSPQEISALKRENVI